MVLLIIYYIVVIGWELLAPEQNLEPVKADEVEIDITQELEGFKPIEMDREERVAAKAGIQTFDYKEFNKEKIERDLRGDGARYIRFFSQDGALSYFPDDSYFKDKSVHAYELKDGRFVEHCMFDIKDDLDIALQTIEWPEKLSPEDTAEQITMLLNEKIGRMLYEYDSHWIADVNRPAPMAIDGKGFSVADQIILEIEGDQKNVSLPVYLNKAQYDALKEAIPDLMLTNARSQIVLTDGTTYYPVDHTNLEKVAPEYYSALALRMETLAAMKDSGNLREKLYDLVAKGTGWYMDCGIALDMQGRSYYSISKDVIAIPSAKSYIDQDNYLGCLLHQIAHSSGAKSRLDRLEPAQFSDFSFEKEEAIAELTAAVVGARGKIPKRLNPESEDAIGNYLEHPDETLDILTKSAEAVRHLDASLDRALSKDKALSDCYADIIGGQYNIEDISLNTLKDMPKNKKQKESAAEQPKQEPVMREVDVMGLMNDLKQNGEAKLSDHFIDPEKDKKQEAKADAKPEEKAEEQKHREPQMVTVNGAKVTHGHSFESKDNPGVYYFTAKIDGVQLRPQRIDPADQEAIKAKTITVPELMQKYYPTKLMPVVPVEEYKSAVNLPNGEKIDKFNVYKEKDEQPHRWPPSIPLCNSSLPLVRTLSTTVKARTRSIKSIC